MKRRDVNLAQPGRLLSYAGIVQVSCWNNCPHPMITLPRRVVGLLQPAHQFFIHLGHVRQSDLELAHAGLWYFDEPLRPLHALEVDTDVDAALRAGADHGELLLPSQT